MKTVYYFWALLPLSLVGISIRGFYKYRLRGKLRDDYGFTFIQAFHAFWILGLAIACDVFVYDTLVDSYDIEEKVFEMMRFLIYPAVLVIVATLQGVFFKKKEQAIPKRRYY